MIKWPLNESIRSFQCTRSLKLNGKEARSLVPVEALDFETGSLIQNGAFPIKNRLKIDQFDR